MKVERWILLVRGPVMMLGGAWMAWDARGAAGVGVGVIVLLVGILALVVDSIDVASRPE